MPTRRATRRQRGGFLDWLFGSTNTSTSTNANEKKNGNYATAAYVPTNTAVGGRRSRKARKTRSHKRAHRNRSSRSRRH